MSGCGCEGRARWLAMQLARLSIRFETRPSQALAQLAFAVFLIAGTAAAAGYMAGAMTNHTYRSRSYASRADSARL